MNRTYFWAPCLNRQKWFCKKFRFRGDNWEINGSAMCESERNFPDFFYSALFHISCRILRCTHLTALSRTQCCNIQCGSENKIAGKLRTDSHSADSDSALYVPVRSQTIMLLLRNWKTCPCLRASSCSAESDSALGYTVGMGSLDQIFQHQKF